MENAPTTDIGFAHAVRYRFAVLRAWALRTGRVDRYGAMSYRSEDLPNYIDIPTNEDISRAEVIEFKRKPLPVGESYSAYLARSPDGAYLITTFTGDVLATVTSINSWRAHGWQTDQRGTFWARGIDGRMYYGRHNGTGMYCRMRVSKNQKDMRQ